MRAIENSEIIERRRRRSRLLGGIVLISIMILSSVGYAFYNYTSVSTDSSNTLGLTYDGQYWSAPYQGGLLRFTSSPQNVSNIPVQMTLNPGNYVGNIAYVDSKNDSYIYGLIFNNLYYSAGRVQQACYGSCVEDLPEKNCTDYMVVFNKSTENKVWQKDNCVFIEGNTNAIDAFFYKLYNIQS